MVQTTGIMNNKNLAPAGAAGGLDGLDALKLAFITSFSGVNTTSSA